MSALAGSIHRLSYIGRRQFDRFWAVAGAVSVRTKILGIVLALVLVLGAGVTLQVRLTLHNALSQNLKNQGISVTRDVAARSVDLLLVRDLYAAHQLLQDTLANNQDVLYAFIVSPQHEILAHTFGDRFPIELIEANKVASTQRYHLQKLETNEGIIWDFAAPIFNGQAGMVRLGLSENAMQTTLANVTRQLLLNYYWRVYGRGGSGHFSHLAHYPACSDPGGGDQSGSAGRFITSSASLGR